MSPRPLLLSLAVLCLCVAAEAQNARGRGVVVAVIGTGIDYNHPAFGGGFGEGRRIAGGWDFVDGDADPMDDVGAGTRAAGLIGAQSLQVTGIAPETTLLAYRVVGRVRPVKAENIAAAIARAVADGADVIAVDEIVLGTPDDAVSRAADAAVAAGVVVVAPIGEGEGPAAMIGSPASARGAIAVGSASETGSVWVASSSNAHGPTKETVVFKPDVLAPASAPVLLLRGQYGSSSGTAVSSAIVAGMAALLRESHPEWTPADIRSALVTTARTTSAPHVLARGGGVVHFDNADAATIFVSETSLMFGLHPERTGRSIAAHTLTLHNRGASAQTFGVSATSSESAAVMTVSPNVVTVPAGGSAEVTLELELDYAALPFPASFVIGGDVSFNGSRSLRVPWAAMRGARVTLEASFAWSQPAMAYGAAGAEQIWPHGGGRGERYVVPGRWDFMLPAAEQKPPRVLIAEDRVIERTEKVPMSFTAANRLVELRARDERGELLTSRSSHRSRLFIGYAHGDVRHAAVMALSVPDVMIAPASERFTFVGGETMIDARRAFSVLHEPLRGITESEVLARDVSHYRHARLTLRPSSAVCWGYVLLTTGVAAGPQCEVITAGDLDYYASDDADIAGQGISVEGSLRVPMLRAIGGEFVFAGFDRVPAPTAYRFRNGGSVKLGEGPLHPGVVPGSFSDWTAQRAGLFGPVGERWSASTFTRWFHMDKREKMLQIGQVAAYQFCCWKVSEGDRYVAQNDAIEGTIFATFGKSGTPRAPRITSLRVVDAAGLITTTIEAGRPAWLEFSVIHDSGVALRSDRMKVLAGRNATGNYRELPFTLVTSDHGTRAELGHDPVGDVYRVSLLPLSDLRGGMQLIIELEDEEGSRMEWWDQFAFHVVDPGPGRRRAARH